MTPENPEEVSRMPAGKLPEVIRLIDIALLFTRRLRLILASGLIGAILLTAVSYLIRPVYTAEAVIISPESMSSSSVNPFLTGALAGGGLVSSLTKNPADLFVAILKGRSITDDIIRKFHLDDRYHKKRLDLARKQVDKRTKLQADKSGLISIDYTDYDPQMAADVANGFVESLSHLQTRLAVTQAAQQRAFYRKQVDDEEDALQNAEAAFLKVQQQTGIVTLTGQTESVIRSIAEQKAAIARQEAELESTRQYGTEESPDVQQREAALRSSREQLARLEAEESKSSPERLRYSTGQPSEAVLAYERTQRDVQYHQAVLQALIKQLETAKLDAERSAPMIQVVDKAVPPTYKSAPKRMLFALAGALLGFVLAFGRVLLSAVRDKVMQDPVGATRLKALRQSLRNKHSTV